MLSHYAEQGPTGNSGMDDAAGAHLEEPEQGDGKEQNAKQAGIGPQDGGEDLSDAAIQGLGPAPDTEVAGAHTEGGAKKDGEPDEDAGQAVEVGEAKPAGSESEADTRVAASEENMGEHGEAEADVAAVAQTTATQVSSASWRRTAGGNVMARAAFLADSGRAKAPQGGRVKKKQAKPYFAKQDKYNKQGIVSNHKKNGKQLERPGIRVDGSDKFRHKGADNSARYEIGPDGVTAVPLDKVADKQYELAINPVPPRKLKLPGSGMAWCVLTFYRKINGSKKVGHGPGWMPVASIRVKGGERALNAKLRAKKGWKPASASTQNCEHYVFKNAKIDANGNSNLISKTTSNSYIRPGQKSSEDKVRHYLQRKVGTRNYYNVSLNLPQPDAPPVAADFAKPGDHFFVPNGKENLFERQVGVFKKKARKTASKFSWVYGFLAKSDGHGGFVPDRKRRGWVPKCALDHRPGPASSTDGAGGA